MKTKVIGTCPFCSSDNTFVSDDIQSKGNVFFIRTCWKCQERFVEYNTIIKNMPWMTVAEFVEEYEPCGIQDALVQ